MTSLRRLLALALVVIAVTGCAGPILANPPAQRPAATVAPESQPVVPKDPQPVELPRDDAPHDRLTEWWYYTGHLRDEEDGRWGFEFVVFRAERGGFPVAWASHLALTDETGGRFIYGQRSEIGPQVDRSPPAGDGFSFALTGFDPTRAGSAARDPLTMSGSGGRDRLAATLAPAESLGDRVEVPLGIELDLTATRPEALHDRDGWIDFGPAGGSYYYSRTRMDAAGTLAVDGRRLTVEGLAWFDHQWGDFIAVGGGGWDWFAINLDDGTDLTISLVRDRDGGYPLIYGTLVKADGTVQHLPRESLSVDVTGRWTSPTTGADYPAGWRIEVPGEQLRIDLRPTVPQQELDTRATTGVVYWEGSQVVEATRAGRAIGGEAYVELTGYGQGATTP